jgi:hypothetical protein
MLEQERDDGFDPFSDSDEEEDDSDARRRGGA